MITWKVCHRLCRCSSTCSKSGFWKYELKDRIAGTAARYKAGECDSPRGPLPGTAQPRWLQAQRLLPVREAERHNPTWAATPWKWDMESNVTMQISAQHLYPHCIPNWTFCSSSQQSQFLPSFLYNTELLHEFEKYKGNDAQCKKREVQTF